MFNVDKGYDELSTHERMMYDALIGDSSFSHQLRLQVIQDQRILYNLFEAHMVDEDCDFIRNLN